MAFVGDEGLEGTELGVPCGGVLAVGVVLVGGGMVAVVVVAVVG